MEAPNEGEDSALHGGRNSACQQSLRECRHHLRQFAQRGETEAAYIVVQETGEKLDFQVGSRHSVMPDWNTLKTLKPGQQVTVLHVHFADVGPGPEDWDALALHPSLMCCEIVCPTVIFVVEKPQDWAFQAHMKPGISLLGSIWDRISNRVHQEAAFQDEGFSSAQAAEIARIAQTNARFLRSVFGRGFTLRNVSN